MKRYCRNRPCTYFYLQNMIRGTILNLLVYGITHTNTRTSVCICVLKQTKMYRFYNLTLTKCPDLLFLKRKTFVVFFVKNIASHCLFKLSLVRHLWPIISSAHLGIHLYLCLITSVMFYYSQSKLVSCNRCQF